MKKISLCLLLATGMFAAKAQLLRAGVYAGVGFASEKSNYLEVSTLPIDKGGFNFHYGLHINLKLAKRLELETGLNKVTKGYEYTTTGLIGVTQYDKITTLTVPATAVFHIIDYPSEAPFRLSFGLGAYFSYAVSGKITDDNGGSQSAKFSNAKRTEFGPRWLLKAELAHKFEIYFSDDIASTNIVKNGSGYIKQGSLQMGFGYVFK